MSPENQVYNLVCQLLKELEISEKGLVNQFCEKLNQKENDPNFTEVERRKLLETIINKSSNPARVISLYDELKNKGIKSMDKLLQLIFLLMSNSKVKDMLSRSKNKSGQKLTNRSSTSTVEKEFLRHKSIKSEIENIFDIRKHLRCYEALEGGTIETSFLKNRAPRDHELLACEDLLYILMGINGQYINIDKKDLKYTIDKFFNPRVVSMIERILPLAIAYGKICNYIEMYPPCVGTLVQQAFCYSISEIQKEYLTFICELVNMFKNGNLNLQKMLYLKESCITEMNFVALLCSTFLAKDIKSTLILSILHEKFGSTLSNGVCLQTCEFLIKNTSKPYFDMISNWIFHGTIIDPYDEFMIVESKEPRLRNSEISEEGHNTYSLVAERIPSFLKDVALKIHNAGRYLNILQRCGTRLEINNNDTKLVYSFYGKEYYKSIDNALSYASKTLLNYIMIDKKFPILLDTLKVYFLLSQGDFFVYFMDSAEGLLKKPVSDIDISKLESLFELAMRNSVLPFDSLSEYIGITLLEDDLETHQLTILGGKQQGISKQQSDGIRTLAFTCNVEWPLSLILNNISISKYQMIFRHILYIKYCNRILSRFWTNIYKNQIHKKNDSSKKVYSLIMSTINIMLHFLNNFEFFIQFDVIDPNWNYLINKIHQVDSIDELIQKHDDFLDKTLKDSMLTHAHLVEGFSNIFNICYNLPTELGIYNENRNINILCDKIIKYRQKFIDSVYSFITLLYGKYGDFVEHNMLFLVEKLDLNHFYTQISSDQESIYDKISSNKII